MEKSIKGEMRVLGVTRGLISRLKKASMPSIPSLVLVEFQSL